MAQANTMLVGPSTWFPSLIHSFPLWFPVSYDDSEMIYKWENFKLEINAKNTWKLLEFDFTGVNNKTEIISTPFGRWSVGARAGQSLREEHQ